jgi:hypothetical protein
MPCSSVTRKPDDHLLGTQRVTTGCPNCLAVCFQRKGFVVRSTNGEAKRPWYLLAWTSSIGAVLGIAFGILFLLGLEKSLAINHQWTLYDYMEIGITGIAGAIAGLFLGVLLVGLMVVIKSVVKAGLDK